MLSTRAFRLACAAAGFVCFWAAPASAHPLHTPTLFTFSGPGALPRVTLPARQHPFGRADANRSAPVFTISTDRLGPATVALSGRMQAGHLAWSSMLARLIPFIGSTPKATRTTVQNPPQAGSTRAVSEQSRRTQLPRTVDQLRRVALVGTSLLLMAASLNYW